MSVGSRLKMSLIDGAELRCAYCGYWWEITPQHWQRRNFSRCIHCINDRARLYQQLRRRDPAFRRADVFKSRRYRNMLRREAPGYLEAYDRERRARRREYIKAYRASLEQFVHQCACGLTLRASEMDIERRVRRHNTTVRHQRWRARMEAA